MATWTIKGGNRAGGVDRTWNQDVSANAEMFASPTLAAGVTAITWTKATISTGTAVVADGHGILNSAIVDIYWVGGIRHGLTATVTVDSIAISGGAGDDLPASGTVVLLATQVAASLAFVGDNVAAFFGVATYRSLVCLVDGSAVVKAFEIPAANVGFEWDNTSIAANPLAGFTVASATISSTDPVSALTETPVTFGVLFDSTPSYPG